MIQKINMKNRKIYFNYDTKGELIEVIIIDNNNKSFQVLESWLND